MALSQNLDLETCNSALRCQDSGSVLQYCPRCGWVDNESGPLVFGNVAILESQQIQFEGQIVDLTPRLLEVSSKLIRAKGRPISNGIMAEALNIEIYDNSIAAIICRVRKKFREIDPNFDQIITGGRNREYRWSKKTPGQCRSHW